MSTLELKKLLKEKIDNLSEDYLLEHLLNVIEVEMADFSGIIPDAHKESIDIGLKQIESGQIVSNQEINNRFQEWVEK